MRVVSDSAELFRHVSAEKAAFYRCIMDVFAAAKRQYRLQLRPDEVLAEARWPDAPPRIEDVSTALTQLAAWGNLESQPDTARVSSLSDFYRARFLYRLSQGGEAVEAALALFVQTLQRRAELQTVALEDIASRLQALRTLADAPEADVAKIHETLRNWRKHVRSFAIMVISIGREYGSATTSCASTAPNPGASARPTMRPPSTGPQVLDSLSRERLSAHCGTKS